MTCTDSSTQLAFCRRPVQSCSNTSSQKSRGHSLVGPPTLSPSSPLKETSRYEWMLSGFSPYAAIMPSRTVAESEDDSEEESDDSDSSDDSDDRPGNYQQLSERVRTATGKVARQRYVQMKGSCSTCLMRWKRTLNPQTPTHPFHVSSDSSLPASGMDVSVTTSWPAAAAFSRGQVPSLQQLTRSFTPWIEPP